MHAARERRGLGSRDAGRAATQVSRSERRAQEADGALPRVLGERLVVGAEAVGVVEERVPGALVVVEGRVDAGVPQLGLELLGVLERDEFVGGAEVAEHGSVDRVKSGLPWGIT